MFARGNCRPMHAFFIFHFASTQHINGRQLPNKNTSPLNVFILKAAVIT